MGSVYYLILLKSLRCGRQDLNLDYFLSALDHGLSLFKLSEKVFNIKQYLEEDD